MWEVGDMNIKLFGAAFLLATIFVELWFPVLRGYAAPLLQQPASLSRAISSSAAFDTTHRVSNNGGLQAQTACPPRYIVRAGDTLSAIARRCGVTVANLKRWNGLHSDLIYVGQTLNILAPSRLATPAPPAVDYGGLQAQTACPPRYIVRAGDTLSAIARRCGVTVANLRRWNGLHSDLIHVSQILNTRAPGSLATPVPPAVPTPDSAPRTYSFVTPEAYWTPPRVIPTITPTPYIESPITPR